MEIKGVTESIVHYLRDAIITGDLSPGGRLNEAALANKLGVSRAPIREAFRVLESDNLIVRVPRRGAYVSELTIENLGKVYEARTMIESFAVDLLEANGTREIPKAEEALKAASNLTLPSLDDREAMLRFVIIFADFHVGMIEATKNDWMISFYRSITFSLARYQFLCLYIPGLTADSFRMHEKILKQIHNGEYAKAKSELLTHFSQTASLIKKQIQTSKAGMEMKSAWGA